MRFALFKYHSGVLYGWSTGISSVAPDRGPSPGGNSFVIVGTGLDPRSWDDLFDDAVLDPKWVNISAGSGSVLTGPFHLQMYTGAVPGSVGGIESVANWGDTQGEIRLILPPINDYPVFPAVVVITALTLWIDANNYSEARLELDSVGNLSLRCDVYVGGALADEMIIPMVWTTGLTMLKILRWGKAVYFYANGDLVFSSVRFTNVAAKFRIWMSNTTSAYDLHGVRVEWFYYRPFAVWQNQPVHDTIVVSDTRMRGTVPPSKDVQNRDAAYQGLVDVSVVGNGTYTSPNAYEYYYIDGLRLINSAMVDTKMDIVNDAQLLTPATESKGLGGGF